MKVLFLPSWYPNEADPLSGTFVREHGRAVALYHEVVVLFPCGQSPRRVPPWRFVWEDTDDGGIRTIRVRYPMASTARGNWLLFVFSLLWGVLRLSKTYHPDVIHAHVSLPAGVGAAIAASVLRIPLVLTEHRGPFSAQMQTWRQRTLTSFVVSRAEAILPVSSGLRRDMEAYGLRGRYHVTPNAVDTSIFYPSDSTTSAGNSILVVAALTPQKGLSILLKAIALVHRKRTDLHVDIVGDGPESGTLKDMATDLELDTVVHFRGAKAKEEVAWFMQRCSFLVLPSLAETFGCVVAEALACGKPVVVTRCGGPEDFVDENVGILVPPDDVAGLGGAIEHMLEHYRAYDPASISNYAAERFSHLAVGSAIDEIYRGISPCNS